MSKFSIPVVINVKADTREAAQGLVQDIFLSASMYMQELSPEAWSKWKWWEFPENLKPVKK